MLNATLPLFFHHPSFMLIFILLLLLVIINISFSSDSFSPFLLLANSCVLILRKPFLPSFFRCSDDPSTRSSLYYFPLVCNGPQCAWCWLLVTCWRTKGPNCVSWHSRVNCFATVINTSPRARASSVIRKFFWVNSHRVVKLHREPIIVHTNQFNKMQFISTSNLPE